MIGDATATHNVALNNSAYSISNYRSSSAEPPPPPTTVDASDGTYADKIAVSWSSVSAATSYNVYYSSSLGGSQTLLGQYTGTSINVTSTAPGAVWYFWVYSFNTNGESATGTYDTGYTTGTAACYALTRSHSGSGSDPSASPTYSSGCSSGNYHAGEVIDLAATPTSGWSVSGWSGTDNNGSTSTSNQVTMPSSARAVSVTYVEAPPPSSGETLFVPITPCRLLDTRVVGGPFGGGTTRSYWIWNGGLDTHQGGAPTCNIPSDAVAVQINFTAVDPSGFGYLRAWPNGLAEPTATMLVFYGGVSISNSVSLMFCNTCGDDMDVRIYDATTDLVAEAVGYYAPVVP